MEISTRSYRTAGMAFTMAGTLALAPVGLAVGERATPLPIVSAPNIQLSAAINPADVQALIANLYSALDDVTQTVAEVSLAPGNSLVDALTSANAVNGEVWNGLINATDSAPLRALLGALSMMSTHNFGELIKTVDALNTDIAVLPAQIFQTIGFAVTGSLTAALGAVTNLINQPSAASSYTGLASSALQQVIFAGQGALQTVDWTGQAVLNAANTVVDGLWEQVPGALIGLDDALYQAAEQSDSAVVDAVIAAVQGLAVAPAFAISNSALGLASSLVGAGIGGFNTAMKSGAWVLAYPIYAVQDALKTVGDKPLDAQSYATALAQLVGGGFNVGNKAITAGASLLSLPVGLVGDLNGNVADTIVSLTGAVGEMGSAILAAAGLPADVAAGPKTLALEVTSAVRTTQKFIDTNLVSPVNELIANAEHGLLNVSSTVQGAVNSALGATDLADPNTRTEWGYHPFSSGDSSSDSSDAVEKAAVSRLKAAFAAPISPKPAAGLELAPDQGDVVAVPAGAVSGTNVATADTANSAAEADAGEPATESPASTGRHRTGASERAVSVKSLLKESRDAQKADREAKREQVRDRLNAGQRGVEGKRGAMKSDRGAGTSKTNAGAQNDGSKKKDAGGNAA